jgi:hypothetical protein
VQNGGRRDGSRRCAALAGLGRCEGIANPGRRFALPWAITWHPFRSLISRGRQGRFPAQPRGEGPFGRGWDRRRETEAGRNASCPPPDATARQVRPHPGLLPRRRRIVARRSVSRWFQRAGGSWKERPENFSRIAPIKTGQSHTVSYRRLRQHLPAFRPPPLEMVAPKFMGYK